MSVHRRISVLLGILAFAFAGASFVAPTLALAQSAGDNQYRDPFAGNSGGSSGGSPKSGSSGGGSRSSGSGSVPPPLSSGPPAAGSSGSASGSGSTGSGTSSGKALPNTGSDTWLVALMGASFLLLGTGMRFRLSELH